MENIPDPSEQPTSETIPVTIAPPPSVDLSDVRINQITLTELQLCYAILPPPQIYKRERGYLPYLPVRLRRGNTAPPWNSDSFSEIEVVFRPILMKQNGQSYIHYAIAENYEIIATM